MGRGSTRLVMSGGDVNGLQKHIYVVVQIYPWFKLYFLLCQNHYHTLPYPKTKKKKKKIKLRIKLNHNMYIICKNLIYSCRGTETLFRSENAGFGKLIINYTLI